jgi:hypothetical protein
MASIKSFDRYPGEYSALFLKALKEEVTVVLTDYEEANRMRSHLYAFRTSALEYIELAKDIALIAPLIDMRIEGNNKKNILIISKRGGYPSGT